MTDFLNSGKFDFLKKEAAMRSHPELLVGNDLSFTLNKGSITEMIRTDLKSIADLIDKVMGALFSSCTEAQLRQVVDNLRDHEFMLPDGKYFRLENIAQGMDKAWYVCEDEGVSHNIYELDLYQLMDIMATTENVLYTSKQNKEKK